MSHFESNESWETFKKVNNLSQEHVEMLQEMSMKYIASTEVVILLAVLYGTISVIAVIGNLLVMFVVLSLKNMQTITNIFIANLAFVDVILGLFAIPFQFQTAVLQRWVIADFMCSVAPFVKNICVSVSVLSLTLIAIDRYIAVIYPLRAGFRKFVAVLALTIIWMLSLVSSIPEGLYYKTRMVFSVKELKEQKICKANWPQGHFFTYYYVFLFLLQYLIPLFIITFSYVRITCHIWCNNAPGIETCLRNGGSRNRNKKKVVKMLIIVVSVFAICWLPLQIYNILVPFLRDQLTSLKNIHIVWLCSNWLAMSNACYNPFIYGLLNEKFKREFKTLMFRFYVKFCKKNRDTYEMTSLRSSFHDSQRGRQSKCIIRQ